MAISLEQLHREAAAAVSQAIDNLEETILPSEWTERGVGWQEHWESAAEAGIYASCDGILLMAQIGPRVLNNPGPRRQELLDRVYRHHLCAVLDSDLPPPSEEARRVRISTQTTTMKLAKFIQASNAVHDHHRDLPPIYDEVLSTLAALADDEEKLCPPVLYDSTQQSLAATCEVLIALRGAEERGLAPIGVSGPVKRSVMKEYHAIEDSARRTALLWSLLEGGADCRHHDISVEEVADVTMNALKGTRLLVEFFPRKVGGGDYYHFDCHFLAASILLRVSSASSANVDLAPKVAPLARETADVVLRRKRYCESVRGASPKFWQNFYAITFLVDLVTSLSNNEALRRRTIMIIEPRHFRRKDFNVDSTLGVVLMPLKQEWSDDVFALLKKTAVAKKFELWRSDLNFEDDIIIQTIWEKINEAAFVVADCTGKNPNVFYELGIAHTLGKKVYIIAQERDDIPFDLAAIRSYEYGQPLPKNLSKLRRNFTGFLATVSD